MKRIVTLMLGVIMALQLWADNSLQAGQQVTIDNDCYATVVPETLEKLDEYIHNENFDMYSTFFKFGYATNLDKDTHAVVVKVQGKKAQIRLDNHMLWWIWTDSINLRNQ